MIFDGWKRRRRYREGRSTASDQKPSAETTLAGLKRGQRCCIVSLPSEAIRAQALRFGIAEGEIVTCLEKIPAGPVVIARNKQEIAIGRRLAQQIQVREIS